MDFNRWQQWVRENRETLVFVIAHVVFFAAAIVFTIIFWQHEKAVSRVRYLGAGVTLWASLHGQYRFNVNQAPTADRWFRGLTVVFHGIIILSCLGLMALHSSVLAHGLVIHFVLTMYLLWDVIARLHYRPRSGWWFGYYQKLLAHDMLFWMLYGVCSYLTFIPGVRSFLFASVNLDSLSDGLTLMVLVIESLDFAILSPRSAVNKHSDDAQYDVVNGYKMWAPHYDKGNAVIAVERDHTGPRIRSLPIKDKAIVDFGCGTGRYLKAFLDAGATKVVGIESSNAMMEHIPDTISSDPRCELVNGGVAALRRLDENSVDGVFCALVVDHLRDHDYTDFLGSVAWVLKPGGWLYISDVNPYFELREHCYARFLDDRGVETRIQVFPHPIGQTLDGLHEAGFSQIELREERIADSTASSWEELKDLTGFPLIIEYFAVAT